MSGWRHRRPAITRAPTVFVIAGPGPARTPVEVDQRSAVSLAPSAGNAQNWHFIVIRDAEQRKRIGSLYRKASDIAEAVYKARSRPQRALRLVGLISTGRNGLSTPTDASDAIKRSLPRWPPLAKGFCLALGTGFAALLAYGGDYRALARDATIPGDRPVRREFERSWPRRRWPVVLSSRLCSATATWQG